LYVHVCKMETLRQAYALAKENDGAPGVDGVTFEAIEAQGEEAYGLDRCRYRTRNRDAALGWPWA
jgi:RNA-directed DNA polymerase